MKNKITLFAVIGILIILIPTKAAAEVNGFDVVLSVSDTSVSTGSSVESTIKITNTDKTYGADIVVSYGGQCIASFYLPAGETEYVYHDVLINAETQIFYTVYASHGPDISSEKNTNTVTVYIEAAATATQPAAITSEPAATDSPSPAPEVTVEPGSYQPETSSETYEVDTDENIGWGTPVYSPEPPEEIFDGTLREGVIKWLGISFNNEQENYMQETGKDIFAIRRLVFGLAALIAILIVFLIITAFSSAFKK